MRAALVLARLAKMSRISSVRSITRQPTSSSTPRICEGDKSSSKMINSACFSLTYSVSSFTFPEPMYVDAQTLGRFWIIRPTTIAPAASANEASSASGS
jgi:hypothetical protein